MWLEITLCCANERRCYQRVQELFRPFSCKLFLRTSRQVLASLACGQATPLVLSRRSTLHGINSANKNFKYSERIKAIFSSSCCTFGLFILKRQSVHVRYHVEWCGAKFKWNYLQGRGEHGKPKSYFESLLAKNKAWRYNSSVHVPYDIHFHYWGHPCPEICHNGFSSGAVFSFHTVAALCQGIFGFLLG